MTVTGERPAVWPAPDDGGVCRYLYAACRGLDERAIDGAPGLRGAPLELVHRDRLTAVVSSVPLAEFGPAPLRRGLEDVDWLDGVVLAHDRAVCAVSAVAPTVPLRLATVCADDDAVRDRLREWSIALACALDRVEGCAEWRVRVVSSTGQGAAEEQTSAVHDRLSRLSVCHRELAGEDPRLSGHSGVLTLNAAYLVPLEAGEAFSTQLAELALADPDLVVDGRGPRPPYAFAMVEQR
jgi:hypothetical protein